MEKAQAQAPKVSRALKKKNMGRFGFALGCFGMVWTG